MREARLYSVQCLQVLSRCGVTGEFKLKELRLWRWKPGPGASSARSLRKVSMLLRSGFRTSINEAAPGELRNQADKADQVGGFKLFNELLVTWGSIIRKFLSTVFKFTRPFNFTVTARHCYAGSQKRHGSQGDWTKRRICAPPGPMLSTKQTIVTMTSERMPLFELLVPSCPHMFKRKNVSRIGD